MQKESLPPFMTSTLQQEAYRKLNFTARKTMVIAQQLYEGIDLGKKDGSLGLITYMRTDSTRISAQALAETRDYILKNLGKEYLPKKPRIYVRKNRAQDAHEAIRPTSIKREPNKIKAHLSKDQYLLYKLIWERFLASQLNPALIEITSIDFKVKQYLFRAISSKLVFPGYRKIYVEGKDELEKNDEKTFPALVVKEELALKKLNPKQHFTQPPPRYTEATLIKTLEEKGIGRPSTYAPILATIVSRGYVHKEKRRFVPTELGVLVVDLLKEYFTDIVDLEFTANLENQLDAIEEGSAEWKKVIEDFFADFAADLKIADQKLNKLKLKMKYQMKFAKNVDVI